MKIKAKFEKQEYKFEVPYNLADLNNYMRYQLINLVQINSFEDEVIINDCRALKITSDGDINELTLSVQCYDKVAFLYIKNLRTFDVRDKIEALKDTANDQ